MLRKLVLSAVALFGLAWQVEIASAAQTGMASYYWQGKLTANGERYNPDGISAAHKTLPFGTLVRVTMVRGGRSIVVRINDRGPFIKGRIIDLSRGAARQLGFINSGVTPVRVDVVGRQGSSQYAKARSTRKATQIAARTSKARLIRMAKLRKAKAIQIAKLRKARATQIAARKVKARSIGGKAKRRVQTQN